MSKDTVEFLEVREAEKLANEKIKEGIEDLQRLGHVNVVRELCELAIWVPGFFPRARGVNGENPKSKDCPLAEAPFLSEAYLYALLGKEAARSLISRINAVCQAVGVSHYSELRSLWEANRTDTTEYRERKEKERVEETKKLIAEGHNFLPDVACPLCPDLGTGRDLEHGGRPRCRFWPRRKIAAALKKE